MSQIFYFDLYGKREDKYDFLTNNDVTSVNWQKLTPTEPNNYFVPKDFSNAEDYEKGFKIDELMEVNNVGVATGKDDLLIDSQIDNLKIKIEKNYNLFESFLVQKYLYRPFDSRYVYFDKKIVQRAREKIMKQMYNDNYALLCTSINRQISTMYFFVSNAITDRHCLDSAGDSMSVFPLYLYQDSSEKSLDFSNPCGNISSNPRIPNLCQQIISKISENLSLQFINDHKSSEIENLPEQTYFTPLDILDYIYAILHKPSYRTKYKEFLKIDFPRIPYPTSKEEFFTLIQKGQSLRKLHLMKSSELSKLVTKYPVADENLVEKIEYKNGNIYINKNQFFENIPETAWNFYIGGYQPLQKYLKDRKNKNLTAQEIMHYQRIVVALLETAKIMEELE